MTTHSQGFTETRARKQRALTCKRLITIGLLLAADIVFVTVMTLGGR